MTDRARSGRLLVALALVIGVVASTVLVQIHLTPDSGLCGGGETFNCSGAAHSRWATLLGIPIAMIGLAFYVACIPVVVRGGAVDDETVGGARLLSTLFAGATLYSVFLAVVSVVDVGSICPWCATLYGANVLGLVGASRWGGSPHKAVGRQVSAVDRVMNEGGSLLLAIFILLVGVGTFATSRMGPPPAPVDGPEVDLEVLYDDGVAVWGDADAPVRLVEFSDFQCPYCSSLAESVDAMKDEFGPEVLRVEFRHYPLPFHTNARGAAIAGVCADEQGLFWDLHDHMFANQSELTREELLAFAQTTALDVGAFEACLDSDQAAARVDADLEAGEALGVQGTPTFFFNGERHVGGYEANDLRRMIRAAVDAAE